jgi:superfamily II DNA/RNA helicase
LVAYGASQVRPAAAAAAAAGKTLVYSLPLICIAVQDEMMLPLESGEGPLGLIVCPSRELASQTVEVITQYTDALKAVRARSAQQLWGLA